MAVVFKRQPSGQMQFLALQFSTTQTLQPFSPTALQPYSLTITLRKQLRCPFELDQRCCLGITVSVGSFARGRFGLAWLWFGWSWGVGGCDRRRVISPLFLVELHQI